MSAPNLTRIINSRAILSMEPVTNFEALGVTTSRLGMWANAAGGHGHWGECLQRSLVRNPERFEPVDLLTRTPFLARERRVPWCGPGLKWVQRPTKNNSVLCQLV